MGSRVTEVVAQELGLTEFKEYTPHVSMLGVTTVEIESGSDKHYRLYLVKDSNEDVTSSLEECARLCAYYNSRFVLQYVRTNKIDYPVGELQINFQIEDGTQNHSVFVLEIPKGQLPKHVLSLEELTVVAENIAKLHGKTAETLGKEFYGTIRANYTNVQLYEKQVSQEVTRILKQSVTGELSQYFSRPHDVAEMLDCLSNNKGREHDEIPYSEVICHGNLTGPNCVFGELKRDLVEITDWESVHFGDPTEDLTSLILTSADIETRRNHFMKIFRAYYYALIEIRPLKFNLKHLKSLYRRNMKNVVLSSVESVLNTLSGSGTVEEKTRMAKQWEAALFDVYHFEFGDYISDDEQCYFEK